jgi:hypothetical protein
LLLSQETEFRDAFASNNLYMMMGYFSIIGLLRVHTLLGDYHLALKMLEPINLTKKVSSVFKAKKKEEAERTH